MSNDNHNKFNELPLLALRGLVAFPSSLVTFDVGRRQSIKALEYSLDKKTLAFLVAQKDASIAEPENQDLYDVGTIIQVQQTFNLPNNMLRVIAKGLGRGKIKGYRLDTGLPMAFVEEISPQEMEANSIEALAFVRTAHDAFEEYSALSGKMLPEAILETLTCDAPDRLADLIGIHSHMDYRNKQILLEEQDAIKRLALAVTLLNEEINILGLQREISLKVKASMEQHQKEYFLREQLKVIKTELGEKSPLDEEMEAYSKRIALVGPPDYVVQKLNKELSRLERTGNSASEAFVIRDYIDWVLDLPWTSTTKESKSLSRAIQILDRDHYGLEKVKERIIEFLAVRQRAAALDAPILCLVGPPGVGKTSVAKSVAKALNRKYIRISLGGIRDEAEIRGHRKTYIGAMPGRIISSIKQAGSNNPLILFDEIDKMSQDHRGDPASAMLEVLDGEQNNTFRDHYLDMPYDISGSLFICTANNIETIPPALKDRLEIITISGYTEIEKLNIAIKFLLPKQLKKHGLKKGELRIPRNVILDIIRYYTREAGVRQLERSIGGICRKTTKELLTDSSKKSVAITLESLNDYLGKAKYRFDKISGTQEPGIARGLAWTAFGGDTLSIEVNTMKGTGKLELTGNLGNVMKESARAALSYIRSQYDLLGLDASFYKDMDIHIHIPNGAVPKDGPSAGITMACAMISALTNVSVKNDLSMTGEITIRGRVLPIGGLKEKALAAKNAGIKKIIIPKDNDADLQELPEEIKSGLEFSLVANMSQVLELAFVTAPYKPQGGTEK